tara:strand:- start:41608 stop:41826 length:219 start_codon:yes stop_codon:yes gene_type:complete
MSINTNRAKYNKALTSMEYTRLMKNDNLYCYICVRRAGGYNFTCHPSAFNPRGPKWREKRSWKNQRKTQWKN